MKLFLGIDLAWKDDPSAAKPNETGVVALSVDGRVLDAGWTRGIAKTAAWILQASKGYDDVTCFVDAPLVVNNASGQRLCETEVGQRYGRWKVSCNSTNLSTPRLGGVLLRERLESAGWQYADGVCGPAFRGRVVSECYPYTAIVGTPVLGYDTERPPYKRRSKGMSAPEFRACRASTCDELIQRLARLAATDPSLQLDSHKATKVLANTASPLSDTDYKHREDLLDAAICAWSAAHWCRWGVQESQVLGTSDVAIDGRRATIIAPARTTQRVSVLINRRRKAEK